MFATADTIRRHKDGSIDIDFYRREVEEFRRQEMKSASSSAAAWLRGIVRLIRSAWPGPLETWSPAARRHL